MLQSIPPSIRRQPRPKSRVKTGKGTPKQKIKGARNLETILEYGLSLEKKLFEVIKIFPSDENLKRLDKIQGSIRSLRQQIALRK